MRTDAEVTAAAERTANAVVTLVGERNRARDLAARLEAESVASSALSRHVVGMSVMIDASYTDAVRAVPELHLRRRCNKIGEEHGEVEDALGGMYGENMRKGVTHTIDDVRSELLDVALCALGALSHTYGNDADPIALLADFAESRHARLCAAMGRQQ